MQETRDAGSIPGSGRSPGGGHGNPLQCSWLENPTDRGAWWAAVHGVTQSWTQLKQFSTHNYIQQIDASNYKGYIKRISQH